MFPRMSDHRPRLSRRSLLWATALTPFADAAARRWDPLPSRASDPGSVPPHPHDADHASPGSGSRLAEIQDPRPAPDQDPAARPARTKNTRFAANIEMWWTKLQFLDRVRAAAELGFPAIEFWPWRNKDIDALAETCRQLGIEVAQFLAWGFSPGLNESKNHDRFAREIEASCAVAKKLRCDKMTVLAGNDVAGASPQQMHEQVVRGLKLAAPIAEQHGVTLILEPLNVRVDHKGHCLHGSEAPVRICREVGSPRVKINWDLYHMQISEGDLCGRLREGFDQVGYVQIADHPGRCEPGTGEIFYPRVLRELKELGYTGFVGVECRPKHSEREAAAALQRADAW
jgi:hydroxypyruvate isomerase